MTLDSGLACSRSPSDQKPIILCLVDRPTRVLNSFRSLDTHLFQLPVRKRFVMCSGLLGDDCKVTGTNDPVCAFASLEPGRVGPAQRRRQQVAMRVKHRGSSLGWSNFYRPLIRSQSRFDFFSAHPHLPLIGSVNL